MPFYMHMPQNQLTLGSTVFSNRIMSAIITRLENGFDTATIEIPDKDSLLYPSIVTAGTAFQFDVKDNSEAAYTTLGKGVVRFPITPFDNNERLQLKCDGSGYGFNDTVCAQEYGSQSRNHTLDTLLEILTDATYGIVPKYVNKILATATDSGFSYDTSLVETITGTIPYLYYPYKPNNKALDDLCDLSTAIKAESSAAGPHWIVTTDDKLHVKQISGTQASWTKYYGDSQANATLTQGVDFTEFQLETIGPEANYIIYNGTWRRPSSGDWAEGNASDYYNIYAEHYTISDDSTNHAVGTYGVKYSNDTAGGVQIIYPSGLDAAWDFSMFSEFNTPDFQFYLLTSQLLNDLGAGAVAYVKMATDATNYYYCNIGNDIIPETGKFYHFNYPIGPYSNKLAATSTNNFTWSTSNSPDWDEINFFDIYLPMNAIGYATIDGVHFGDSQITRIAKNSTNITANKVKMKTITDLIGKDDTLKSGTPGTTDTGLMARLAYTELLRLQKTAFVGTVTIPMLKDALPGQHFHIQAKKKPDGTYNIDKDMRATKVTHTISSAGYFTTLTLTDDLTNSHARTVYEDRNKVMEAARPGFQDRQASSIKAGNIDIRITALTEDYSS